MPPRGWAYLQAHWKYPEDLKTGDMSSFGNMMRGIEAYLDWLESLPIAR